MSATNTRAWMQRNHLKAVTVYFHDMVFKRVEALAKAERLSKGHWVHNLVIERLRKSATPQR
jgi:hypothetical protein